MHFFLPILDPNFIDVTNATEIKTLVLYLC